MCFLSSFERALNNEKAKSIFFATLRKKFKKLHISPFFEKYFNETIFFHKFEAKNNCKQMFSHTQKI